ncbi:MAG: hypothetical protein ACREIU_08620, partial [Planctomycetota bacterium]
MLSIRVGIAVRALLSALALAAVAEDGLSQGCPACSGSACGRWEAPFDWAITVCPGDPGCPPSPCSANLGALTHAVLLVLDTTPVQWRVLFWDEIVSGGTIQSWYVWDPASPSVLQQGVSSSLASIIFCGGHSRTRDRRIVVGGGTEWTYSSPPGPCPNGFQGEEAAYIYDPLGVAPPGEGPGLWTLLSPMVKKHYYPSTVQFTNDQVGILAGDAGPIPPGALPGTTFEVYDPNVPVPALVGSFSYSTVPQCPMTYPNATVLPSTNPGQFSETLFVSVPYHTAWPCGGTTTAINSQRANIPLTGGFGGTTWLAGPTPATEQARADCPAVTLVDLTVTPPSIEVVIGGGKEDPFSVIAPYDSVERVVNPHLGTGWTQLPDLVNARFNHDFIVLPGKILLALGGETLVGGVVTPVFVPEILDLNSPTCWQALAPHTDDPRGYHSFAMGLPDGRVLHGGGQRFLLFNYSDARVFNPPNLFAGPRATIRSAPRDWFYGQVVTVLVDPVPPGGISSFELIRPDSVT